VLSHDLCARLRETLLDQGFTTTGVRELLGHGAHAALTRGEPEAAARATREAGELGALVRLFLLGGTEEKPPLPELDALVAGGLLTEDGGYRAAMDLRPYGEEDTDWYILSDLDTLAARQDRDHVTGVGGASLTLASSLVRTPVVDTLDLGTGCGVQALHASRFSERVVATDVAPKALEVARATLALSGVTGVELVEGPWFAPVADRRFDAIVSNPPFVPGPGRVEYVYRDSGVAGDAALAGLLADVPGRLRPGGRAQLLGSWLHVRGEDWPDRVRSWIPAGCDAWILQREVTDPVLHVGTWQRDAGLDLASPATREAASAWLDWLDAERVEGVGFGFLLLRKRSDGLPGEIVVEDLQGDLADPLNLEMAQWLDRIEWLRRSDAEILAARLRLAPTATLENYSTVGEEGWADAGSAVVLADGPQWRHEVDAPAAALLAGCNGALPLEDVITLLAFAHDRPTDALVQATLPAVREFVRHGVLVPA
jgi:methylase of polypeptide subunit release factors